MKTILRKINNKTYDYYAVIEHDLENFELRFLKSWEMTAHEDSSSYRVNRGVQLPSYVTEVSINNEDVMNTFLKISDLNNVFSLMYKALLEYSPTSILKDYPDYDWVFNKEALYLSNRVTGEKISILEPYEYWKGNKPENNKLYYDMHDTNNYLSRKLLHSYRKPLVNTDLDKYSYPVFRTIWYDTLVYTEYVLLQLEALNVIHEVFSKYSDTDIILLNKPVTRTSIDFIIQEKIDALKAEVIKSDSLTEMYSILNKYDNPKLSNCYISVLKELSFKTELIIDWDTFKTVYKKYLDKYLLAIMMYLRWNFIRGMIPIPENFNIPLSIITPLGRLIVKGGEPLWEKV